MSVLTNKTEEIIGLRNTRAFINAHVSQVRLLRPQVQLTEAGGVRKTNPLELKEQSFRIVPMSGLVWDRSRITPDEGRVSDVTEMLIGMPDADVKKDDYFPHDGGWFKVVHVSPVKGYRKECRLRYTETEPKS